MKVKELIGRLSVLDPETEVLMPLGPTGWLSFMDVESPRQVRCGHWNGIYFREEEPSELQITEGTARKAVCLWPS